MDKTVIMNKPSPTDMLILCAHFTDPESDEKQRRKPQESEEADHIRNRR